MKTFSFHRIDGLWIKIFLGLSISIMFAKSGLAVNIPEDVKKVVTFVFYANEKGEPIPSGTAFFVGVKNESNPDRNNVCLVTSKHVLQDQKGDFYPAVLVRLNKLQGGFEFVHIDLAGENRTHVYTHPTDETVDIAVIPALPDQKIFDFKFLPDDLLTTRESFDQLKISEGSDIFFTGLFMPFYGQSKNYPIVRFGRVAMISDERIPWKEENKEAELLQLYLIETQSFGGNSGSPVFFYLGSDRTPGVVNVGPPILRLAGIMKGTFLEAQPVRTLETKTVPFSVQNIGIAAVVPSYLLHEILFSSEIKEQRVLSK